MKVLLNTIYYLFVAGVVAIALLLVTTTLVPTPGNIKVKVVKSGSMEPAIKTGGLVFIKSAEVYEVGDVITFGKDTPTQIPTTHRIIEKIEQGSQEMFITKGDANDSPDPIAINPKDVSGKVIFDLPYLGYILDFAKRPAGFLLLVGVPALAIIFDEIGKIIREVKSIRQKKTLNAEKKENQQNKDSENP